jgi:tetratricopeptide (TPR) repeat protein
LLNNLGVALIKLGKFDEAIIELNFALFLNSKMEELHLNLGICYFSIGKYEESLDCFKNALNLNDKNEINLIFYAQALSKLNEPV